MADKEGKKLVNALTPLGEFKQQKPVCGERSHL